MFVMDNCMPVEFTKITGPSQLIGLWRIEDQNNLTSRGNVAFQRSYEVSHTEACRELIKAITGIENLVIDKDKYGKPFIQNNKSFISFSHSGNYAAAILNKEASVGIDIQLKKDKIVRLANKFCSEQELQYINQVDQIDYLHIIWGAKEAMFKQYGKGEVLFKEHIFVHPFNLKESGSITVTFKKHALVQTVNFDYQCNEDYYLVYTASNL